MPTLRSLKSRFRRSKGGPSPPSLIDYEVQTLGGTTSAFDTTPEHIQAQKAPISKDERIVELVREQGRLRCEIEYYRSLVEKTSPLIPLLSFHLQELSSVIRVFNHEIERANKSWLGEELGS